MSADSTPQPFTDDAAYYEQVQRRFSSRSQSFNKQISVLVTFSLAFLVFVIVPLVALNADKEHVEMQEANRDNLVKRLKGLDTERVALMADVDRIRDSIASLTDALQTDRGNAKRHNIERSKLTNEIEKIRQETQVFEARAKKLKQASQDGKQILASFDANKRVDDLRNWFIDAAYKAGSGGPECNQYTVGEREYMRCIVRLKLEGDWNRDFKFLNEKIVLLLREIAPNAAIDVEVTLKEARKRFQSNLDQNRDFWTTIDGKGEFMGELNSVFSHAFNKISEIVQQKLNQNNQKLANVLQEASELEALRRVLEQRLAVLDGKLAALESDVEKQSGQLKNKEAGIEDNKIRSTQITGEIAEAEAELKLLPTPDKIVEDRNRIEKRVNSFKSPFGSLPIGLNEAVFAYPLILAIGTAICAFLLRRLLKLRGELHSVLKRLMSVTNEDIDRRLEILAPIWFDPGRAIWRNLGVVLAFAVPLVLFAASAWLVFNDWLLRLGRTPSAVDLRVFYGIVYLCGAGVILVAIGCLIGTAMQFRKLTRP